MSFEEFLAAELEGLARYAQVLTGDRQQAHDIVAEAMIKVALRWERISNLAYPLAYVRRVLTNQYLQERRSDRNLPSAVPGTLAEQSVRDSGLDRIADRSHLHLLLASLPRQQRAAIVLRYYLDLTDAEIAEELGCSPGAVRTYISRGLAALRLRDDVDQPARPGPAARRPGV